MKLRIASDIHLDINENWRLKEMAGEGKQVLILAGDIARADYHEDKNLLHDWWEDLSNRFYHVIVIMGNHDFYYGDLYTSATHLFEQLVEFPNITLLDNAVLELDDIMFVGTTLWTDFNDRDMHSMLIAPHVMLDYRVTKGLDGRMETNEVLWQHWKHRDFIYAMAQVPKRKVLITHHLPHWNFVSTKWQFAKDTNPYFFSNLDENKLQRFEVCFAGHTHECTDFQLGKTRCVVNPVGYGFENPYFDHTKVVEI